jgi:hypothetical protein
VGTYKGLQAKAINRNPAITKSFLWIIVLPYPSLSIRTKRFSLFKSLSHDASFGTKLRCSNSTLLAAAIQDLGYLVINSTALLIRLSHHSIGLPSHNIFADWGKGDAPLHRHSRAQANLLGIGLPHGFFSCNPVL